MAGCLQTEAPAPAFARQRLPSQARAVQCQSMESSKAHETSEAALPGNPWPPACRQTALSLLMRSAATTRSLLTR